MSKAGDGPDGPALGPGSEDDRDLPAWARDVLHFWFTELTPVAWFKRDDAVDAAIRDRFAALHAALAAAPPGAHPSADDLSPRLALAAVLVLDQMPRNMFRGTAAAFASDPQARAISHAAVARGLDVRLERGAQRLFLYLPFEHSEAAADQELSVRLIERLGDAEWTRYAWAHKHIIDRFGRYPHRNAALGRDSTPDEIAFLSQPGSSF